MRVFIRKTVCVILALLCLLPELGAVAEEKQEEGVVLTPTSITGFANAVSHYVSFDASFEGAEWLVLRVYRPDGSQSAFRTRKHVREGKNPVRSVAYDVSPSDTDYRGIEIYFKKGFTPGVWTIVVSATDKEKNEISRGTLAVEVRETGSLEYTDYVSVHGMLTSGKEAVEAGRVRLVTQLPDDPCFVKKLWKNKAYDLTENCRTMCTRSVFSMAMSYLGIDCSPARMSEITRSEELFYTYEKVAEKLGNISRVKGTVEELWELYEGGGYSPICVHFSYTGDGMHSLLLIARDSKNPELYYAVNSSVGINALKIGGQIHDHLLPVVIDDGRVGCLIQSPLYRNYNGGRIDEIWCWHPEDAE